MNDNQSRHKESLSTLMDGVAGELELHRTLKAISEDAELRATWSRYHLVRSTIHNELPETFSDLSSSIGAAIAEEPEHKFVAARSVWRSIGRAAIAASVTVVAVLGVQQFNLSESEHDAQVLAVEQAGQPVLTMPSGFRVPTLVTRNVSSDNSKTVRYQPRPMILLNQSPIDSATKQQIERYFNTMMERHTQNYIEAGRNGLLPYARLPQAIEE
jgi:sigma-E factor negative regulatory protein RseA